MYDRLCSACWSVGSTSDLYHAALVRFGYASLSLALSPSLSPYRLSRLNLRWTFSSAHVHHAYDVFASNGKTKQAFKTAFFTCRSSRPFSLPFRLPPRSKLTLDLFESNRYFLVFQFTYTTLFGWFAAHLFVKTGASQPPLLPPPSLPLPSSLLPLTANSLASWLVSFHTGTLAPSLTAHVFCNIFGLPQPFAAMERHPTKKADIFVMYLLGIGGFAWAMYIGW